MEGDNQKIEEGVKLGNEAEVVEIVKTEKSVKKTLPEGMTPWKKGQSGNPNGRPKGTFSFIPLLKNALKEMHLDTNKSKAKVVVEKLIEKAIQENDIVAMKELMNRIDGMPPHTFKGDKENPLFQLIIKRNEDGNRDEGNRIDDISR